MNILERARVLVCEMSRYEARRLDLLMRPMGEWPDWARRDFKLACDALVAVRKEALEERRP